MRTYEEELVLTKARYEKYDCDPKVKEALLIDEVAALKLTVHRSDILFFCLVTFFVILSIAMYMVGRSDGFIAGSLNAMELIAKNAPSAIPAFF
jgi:hypothetical protein